MGSAEGVVAHGAAANGDATLLVATLTKADQSPVVRGAVHPNRGVARSLKGGSAIGEVQLVRLQFVHQTAALGQANLDLPVQGEGAFAAEGAYFNQAGPWNVTVYVRRRGMDDALAQTTVNVPAPVNTASKTVDPWQNPITALPGDLVIGGVFIGLLIAFFLWRNAWLNYHEPTT